jgi:hypothetical protein
MPGKHDDTLFKLATRIQARAMQRVGELLKEIKPAKNQHDAAERARAGGRHSRSEAAANAGLSKHQRRTALRVARIPPDRGTAPAPVKPCGLVGSAALQSNCDAINPLPERCRSALFSPLGLNSGDPRLSG